MGPGLCTLAWVGSNLTMGRASLLGVWPNSFHKAEVWACTLGLFSTPSNNINLTMRLLVVAGRSP